MLFASVGYAELLGVELLSAVLKRGGHRVSLVHDPALFDDRHALNLPRVARMFGDMDRTVAAILAAAPDLLAFSAMTATFAWAREVARRVRAVRRIPTIFGGTHPSAAPAFCMGLDEIDFVCVGEGEHALLELVDQLGRGGDGSGIKNIWSKPDGVPMPPPGMAPYVADLDALPFPDKALYAPWLPQNGMYNIMSSRGCPYRCTFCFNSNFGELDEKGRRWGYLRRRTVESVLAELTWARRQDAFRYVEFHDDIFTTDTEWLREFAPRYRREIGVPFGCSSHARYLDEDRIRLLHEAGCARVKMGVQSLDTQEYRRKVLRRAEKDSDVARAIDTCRRVGVRIEVDQIVGLPGESPDAREGAIAFFREHPPDRIGAYWFTWFPGTELTNKAIESGELSAEETRAILEGITTTYREVELTGRRRDPVQDRLDRGYQAALDLMPNTPAPLRGLLKPDLLGRAPALVTAARWAMAAGMIASLRRGGGEDALAYFRWYAHNGREAVRQRAAG